MLKKGKYGLYVSCNGKNYSVKHLKKKMERVEVGGCHPCSLGGEIWEP